MRALSASLLEPAGFILSATVYRWRMVMRKKLVLLVLALAAVAAASVSSAASCPPNMRTVNCGSYTLCCHWYEVCICS